ncbi:NusG domain II-containing protein [Feifania hominis]|uniref:NusG domain II-containing protein n=1 Tax=Feifania hominis TaxID=2763660 RepID=A0A926DBB1_9FIRM|nr:NusG domain II-containing protein [Feifania hominis]MBC8535096.1 NusG domain II-containing protein [Feifania hominis]
MKLKIKLADILIIVAVLSLAGALFFLPRLWQRPGGEAVVEVGGEVVERIALDGPDGEIEVSAGELHFVLERRGGAVAMREIDCPDRVCMRTGFVRDTGESIVCLPNRVIVRVEGARVGEVDIVAG